MENLYFMRRVKRVDFKVHNPHGREEFCSCDIVSWAEDEHGVTFVNALPIDDLQRGSVCDLTVHATAVNVYDCTGLEPKQWMWRDLLCIGVDHNQESASQIKVTYRFIK